VVVGEVCSPVHIESDAVVRSLRLELGLFAVDDAFVDHELGAAFENRSGDLVAVDFQIQPRFAAAAAATATSTAASTAARSTRTAVGWGLSSSGCRWIGDPFTREPCLRIHGGRNQAEDRDCRQKLCLH